MADVFISHASEDKDIVARPLAQQLVARGYSVWFDEYTLKLGDSLPQEIDRGLASCHVGVVILSTAFFRKAWPRRELDGLIARETGEEDKRILPIWHNVTVDIVRQYSPTLASKFAISTEKSLDLVAAAVIQVLEDRFRRERRPHQTRSVRGLVLEHWLDVEKAVEKLADHYQCFGSPNSHMVRRLNDLGILNEVLMASYRSLRRFRDDAVHEQGFALSTEEVERYSARVQSLVTELHRLVPATKE